MLPYALTILISAFLLFQIQPIIAKMILPWFGGSAAVWTTCMVFFQVALLAGYLYAFALFRSLRPRHQARVHLLLLVLGLAMLPVIPSASWKPLGHEEPIPRILGLLTVTIGLPYFLLCTTGPLLQAWYASPRAASPRAVLPYRLYALSNAGSLFALVSFPVLFEPFFTTKHLGWWWSAGYALFTVSCGFAALRFSRSCPDEQAGPLADPPGETPGWQLYVLWAALPACASVLLLAVANHISQNVAAVPFLWVLPLSLYLLSFILCFEGEGWYMRRYYLPLLVAALGGMAYGLSESFNGDNLKVLISLFSTALFVCSMVCHGEVAKLKPHPRHLTSFYLMLSFGGALGGAFVGLLAPKIFNWHYELPVGIVACAALVALTLARGASDRWWKGWRKAVWLAPVGLAVTLGVYLVRATRESAGNNLVMVRNFYGGLRVSDEVDGGTGQVTRKLLHGTINHGEQLLGGQRRYQPTTYYGLTSGVGLVLKELEGRSGLRVGVIGLGAGTLAAYGKTGDIYRFYEINPLVIDLARSYFTFLRDSRAKVEVVLGDARLSLDREKSQNFDVLAVDAFAGDSIPIHLLTAEAFGLYFRRLKDSGVLAVHISNKHLDLVSCPL